MVINFYFGNFCNKNIWMKFVVEMLWNIIEHPKGNLEFLLAHFKLLVITSYKTIAIWVIARMTNHKA